MPLTLNGCVVALAPPGSLVALAQPSASRLGARVDPIAAALPTTITQPYTSLSLWIDHTRHQVGDTLLVFSGQDEQLLTTETICSLHLTRCASRYNSNTTNTLTVCPA